MLVASLPDQARIAFPRLGGSTGERRVKEDPNPLEESHEESCEKYDLNHLKPIKSSRNPGRNP